MSDHRWQKIEEIFNRAIELAPEARPAFLAGACGADESLRIEVESLLAHDSENDRTFEGPPPDEAPEFIAHYRVVEKLGEGGMGSVYRATDTRLNREVAIKLLPPAFSRDAARMARFDREARILASLNHPNIAAVYGIEEGAIVMELVEGQELKGPVPQATALHYARQIAAALETAHEKGVIHRDLKPANIKVTEEGKIKVLDFGLAKVFEREGSGSKPGASPTLSMNATRAGVILGTAGYMSPEQARGKPVDRRTDIWAFGAIFYEMLTGRTVFDGETASDKLAAVLRDGIDWSRLPAETSPGVRRLLERCLQRDPHHRLRDIGDAWIEFDQPQDTPVRRRMGAAAAGLSAAALVAGLAAGWLFWHSAPPPPAPVVRWSEAVTADEVALSPDGTRLIYGDGLHAHSFVRMLDRFDWQPVPNFGGGFAAFSPDGQWFIFANEPGLQKEAAAGGTPVTLLGQPGCGQPAWGDDGAIIFTSNHRLMQISDQGGTARALTTVDEKKGEGHSFPHFLPGSRYVLFTIQTGNSLDNARVALLDRKTGSWRAIREKAFDARYVASGHLLYMRGATLLASPFDLKHMQVTGGETPVVDGLLTDSTASVYSVSSTGVLAYLSGVIPATQVPSTMEWRDRSGGATPAMPARLWGNIALSPDGTRVAASIWNGGIRTTNADLWIYEFARGTLTRLTFDEASVEALWTPDGSRIVIGSDATKRSGIYWIRSDFSGRPELLIPGDGNYQPSHSWSPDGKLLLYSVGAWPKRELWLMPVPGGPPRPFLQGPANLIVGRISPDGKWVAYESAESGRSEVYVQSFPTLGAKVQVSAAGGIGPRWRKDGRELFFSQPGLTAQAPQSLMAAQVWTAGVFKAGPPHRLFELLNSGVWDPAPDGTRFLVEHLPEAAQNPKVNLRVVTNWFEELRRRVPAR